MSFSLFLVLRCPALVEEKNLIKKEKKIKIYDGEIITKTETAGDVRDRGHVLGCGRL